MRLLVVLLAIALAGCSAGNSFTSASLLTQGVLEVEPADPGAPYDYKLTFPNVRDVGYDLDRRADREELVSSALSDACPSARIVDETRVLLGSPLGRELATFTVFVACS